VDDKFDFGRRGLDAQGPRISLEEAKKSGAPRGHQKPVNGGFLRRIAEKMGGGRWGILPA
jgi:hypothetical protein